MEFVFVVPRTELFPEWTPHGLSLFDCEAGAGFSQQAFQECLEKQGFYVERQYAERTPALKQVIPYTVVVRDEQILCLRRTKAGGESRLHDKLSIGVGGHVNPIDSLPEGTPDSTGSDSCKRSLDPVPRATHREVAEEELTLDGDYSLHMLGILNDDTNPVGAVHVGLVQILATSAEVQVREIDMLEGDFRSVKELRELEAEGAPFETWSALLLPHLEDRILPVARSPKQSPNSDPTIRPVPDIIPQAPPADLGNPRTATGAP